MFDFKDWNPTAVLLEVVFAAKAWLPTAVLFEPVTLLYEVPSPKATLFDPVVFL